MKIEVTVTHVLDLPDDTEIVAGPGGDVIKLSDVYLSPQLGYCQCTHFDSSGMRFDELSEDVRDRVTAALAHEGVSVLSVK
jgi:hypothetical protein